jgi:hypothetical protein
MVLRGLLRGGICRGDDEAGKKRDWAKVRERGQESQEGGAAKGQARAKGRDKN